MNDRAYLLIARKDGSSSSRRQRAFPTRDDVTRAIDRWRKEGFNTWWLYGAGAPGSPRPLLNEWQDTADRLRIEGETYVNDGLEALNDLHSKHTSIGEPTHPATGEPTNAARAARVDGAITAYARHCYGSTADQEDHETVAQDFLTDVFHWIRLHQLEPSDIAQRAANMVQAEIELEDGEPA
jgi:hypothetical protein